MQCQVHTTTIFYFIFQYFADVTFEVLVAQSCLTLSDPMDCNPPGSSVYGILQARILECNAIPFSRWSSQPRDWTPVCGIAGRFFTIWATMMWYMKDDAIFHIC